jgi:hypothetical protein
LTGVNRHSIKRIERRFILCQKKERKNITGKINTYF